MERLPEVDVAVEAAVGVEVVDERLPGAYGFTVKSATNGRLHRILPARDPRQPRFWCVEVYRCARGGLPDASERPWIGSGGLRREELQAVLGAIRADPNAWLAEAAHRELRDWMLAPAAAEPPLPQAVLPSGRRQPAGD